jgi:hypothetical protein
MQTEEIKPGNAFDQIAAGPHFGESILTKRHVSHAEAREVMGRLVNSHFRQEPHARIGIPARPDYDDDLLMSAYIRQQELTVNALCDALVDCLREHGGFTIKGECERKARAAIEAMREPTREMWAAGADACVTKVNVHHDKVVGDVWAAMLGAAVSTDKNG